MKNIGVEKKGKVLILTMNRQENENRITQAMAEAMADELRLARNNEDIGACVITGAGPWFSTGGDYQGAKGAGGRAGFAETFANLHLAMNQLGKPLIAAINGTAHAGGFSLVVACDLAVMSEDTTLALPEAVHGFFPLLALAAVKHDLPKKLLFDMVYCGRELSAEDSLRNNFVTEIAPAPQVAERALSLATMAAQYDAEIVKVGRDLYYGMRGMDPKAAFDASRFALFAAYDAWDRQSRADTA